jgi:hypothetical protein
MRFLDILTNQMIYVSSERFLSYLMTIMFNRRILYSIQHKIAKNILDALEIHHEAIM